MNIAVLSDTHGNLNDVKKFLGQIKNVDVIIHLGDYASDGEYIRKYFNGRFIGIKGNCDFNTEFPEDVITTIGDKKFFITHGHKYNVKFGLINIKIKSLDEEADVALFGHTHKAFCEKDHGVLFINPGSLSEPQYNEKKTYCMINIDKDEIKYEIKILIF